MAPPVADHVIKGRIWNGTSFVHGHIGIDRSSGRITCVDQDAVPTSPGATMDELDDRAIIPAGIDIHVHFRDPGHTHKEDFATGTRAALHGGVTTVLDMPNTDPATTSAGALAAKRDLVRAKAHVDWGLYGGITAPGAELRALAAKVDQLKCYLGESTGCVTLEDPATLPAVFGDLAAARFTGVLAFHAEAKDTLETAGRQHADEEGLAGHLARRPPEAEMAAFFQIEAAHDAFVKDHGTPPPFTIHIAHASTPELIDISEKRGWSYGVTPQHLMLDVGMPLGARGRLNPPLRDRAMADAMWQRLVAGRVPIVESDHAPHTAAEKDQPVSQAPSGMPGVETMLPLLMARAAAGDVPYAHVIEPITSAPARLFNLDRGAIMAGNLAELAVFDLDRVEPLDQSVLVSKCTWTPFAGHDVIWPTRVYRRGHRVLDGHKILANPGDGDEIHPENAT